MHLNKVMIIGNLTRDPEVKTTPSGQTVASFAVATNFSWVDQSGKRQEKPEFHNIVAWRKLAEICGTYLFKGKQVYIEGRLQTRDWTDQNGIRKYRTEIIAENMIMLGSPKTGGGQVGTATAPNSQPQREQMAQDIPTIDQETPSNINPSIEDPSIKSEANNEEDIQVEDIPF